MSLKMQLNHFKCFILSINFLLKAIHSETKNRVMMNVVANRTMFVTNTASGADVPVCSLNCNIKRDLLPAKMFHLALLFSGKYTQFHHCNTRNSNFLYTLNS